MRTLLLAGLLTLGACTGANVPTFQQAQAATGGVCAAVDIGAAAAAGSLSPDMQKAVTAFDGLCATAKALDPNSASVGQFLSDFAAKAGPLVQGLPLTATQKAEAGVALALIGAFAPFIPVEPPLPIPPVPPVVTK